MPRCNFLTYFKVDFLGSTEAWKAFGSFGYMIFCLYMFMYICIFINTIFGRDLNFGILSGFTFLMRLGTWVFRGLSKRL